MTQFIEFSATRKAAIKHMYHRLTTIKPVRCERYGTITSKLNLLDYTMYAALRGADIRKVARTHADLEGTKPKEALLQLKRFIKHGGAWANRSVQERFLGVEVTPEAMAEVVAIIDEALEKAA